MSLRMPGPRDIGIVLLQLVLAPPLILFVYVRQVIGNSLRREAHARDNRLGKRHPVARSAEPAAEPAVEPAAEPAVEPAVGHPGRADAPTSAASAGPVPARHAPSAEGRNS